MNSVERELWDHKICIFFIQLKVFTECVLCARLWITIISKEKQKNFPVLMELQINIELQLC